ncbi:hypothetical protein L211DRAFT_111273 [Terfezia boudieri ATCC MYA-4762]|uniref:Uncharacterized protein n=1 Tax=Terfezia boudieri ATCC MYA-4762 TaxID=1051890 RepID=A0A3N4LVS6_9PEZI|nr:hypothetical protein L211DRAFT_111273 [Terfezia boudieri ATCC MYA-4762]
MTHALLSWGCAKVSTSSIKSRKTYNGVVQGFSLKIKGKKRKEIKRKDKVSGVTVTITFCFSLLSKVTKARILGGGFFFFSIDLLVARSLFLG